MDYFPMFIELKGREVLICGGGKHAVEKIERLKPFNPKFRIITQNPSEEIRTIAKYGDIPIEKRTFITEDLVAHPVFVIAAECEEENERIAEICRSKNIPINAVDQIKDCDFIFPSMLVSEHLCVGISTGGVSPTGAICLKNHFSEIVPDNIDEILLWLKDVKNNLKEFHVEKNKLNMILVAVMDEAIIKDRILTDSELKAIYMSFDV